MNKNLLLNGDYLLLLSYKRKQNCSCDYCLIKTSQQFTKQRKLM